MPATASEKTRFRRQLGDTETSLPDAELDDLFDEAESLYPTYDRSVQFAGAKLQAIEDKLMQAASQVSYSEGGASESLSDMYRNLERMRTIAKQNLEEAIADATGSAVKFGGMVKTPRRDREVPNA